MTTLLAYVMRPERTPRQQQTSFSRSQHEAQEARRKVTVLCERVLVSVHVWLNEGGLLRRADQPSSKRTAAAAAAASAASAAATGNDRKRSRGRERGKAAAGGHAGGGDVEDGPVAATVTATATAQARNGEDSREKGNGRQQDGDAAAAAAVDAPQRPDAPNVPPGGNGRSDSGKGGEKAEMADVRRDEEEQVRGICLDRLTGGREGGGCSLCRCNPLFSEYALLTRHFTGHALHWACQFQLRQRAPFVLLRESLLSLSFRAGSTRSMTCMFPILAPHPSTGLTVHPPSVLLSDLSRSDELCGSRPLSNCLIFLRRIPVP